MKRATLFVLVSVLAVSAPALAQPETVVSTSSVAPVSRRLPILGATLDAGLPDGLMGSVTVRPLTWLRASLGAGSNGISAGFRAGLTLLPLGTGPSASLEYGRYLEGNANALSQSVLGKSSPLLDRVGYQFANAHLGVAFGLRRCVFFIHGGVSVGRGTIHNLDSVIPAPTGNGTTQVSVRRDPNAQAVGPSLKLGLVVYIL
jgi:hypothetical protein